MLRKLLRLYRHVVLPLLRGGQGGRESGRVLPPVRPRYVRPNRQHHLPRHDTSESEGTKGHRGLVPHGRSHSLFLWSVFYLPGGSGDWSTGHGTVHG